MNVSTGGRQLRGRASATALACAIALIPGLSYAAPHAPGPDPGPGGTRSIEQVGAELDGLYRQAEVATEAYNTANEKATDQTKRLASLRADLTRIEGRVGDLHALAGAAARTQYRGGYLNSTGVQLLLGEHPDHALDDAAQAQQAMQNIINVSEAQKAARAELEGKTDAAAKDLKELNRTLADKAGAKEQIEKKIADAERIEAGLRKEETDKLAQLERQRTDEAKSKWPVSGPGGGTSDKGGGGTTTSVSGAAGKALAFAMDQIGKPYVWGAVGPSSFDCSGLTSTAWAAAGHPIPRTSQAQWHGLTRVSLSSAQPGDLIIYFKDATHVGMYIGGGQIVHAPRPGRTITTAPAASMPILGVVRPGV
ncbi:NlpC/P60 family protein [Streptomyces sp. NPDC048111]|uniref:C40 family peptidase n=1 Tax=Streptomyces sp. NPDC048111 TaxID=3365500 RepID=UPI0037108EEF